MIYILFCAFVGNVTDLLNMGSCLLGCDVVLCDEWLPTFRRIVVSLASRLKQSKKNVKFYFKSSLWV
jgi:hypothetical protein